MTGLHPGGKRRTRVWLPGVTGGGPGWETQVKYGGVDAEHVVVGFLEATRLVELSFDEFLVRFPSDEAVPTHQVKYFKEYGELVLSLQEPHTGKGGGACNNRCVRCYPVVGPLLPVRRALRLQWHMC